MLYNCMVTTTLLHIPIAVVKRFHIFSEQSDRVLLSNNVQWFLTLLGPCTTILYAAILCVCHLGSTLSRM